MSDAEQDVAAARSAARVLIERVTALHHRFGDSVDMRRLIADTERIAPDLDLLVGQEQPSSSTTMPVVIPDEDYPPELFADADDEGLGSRR